MSDNKRNIDSDPSPSSAGPVQRTGTGSHEQNRVETGHAQQDNKALGQEAHRASGDKPADGRKGR